MSERPRLSKQQEEFLQFLRRYSRRNHRSPSYQEITDGLSFASTRAVGYHIERLEEMGYIRRRHGSRGLEIIGEPSELSVPYRGRVSCGLPRAADAEDSREWIDFAPLLVGDGIVAMQAIGNSMVEAQIASGDYLLVRECPDPESGQTVIAVLGEEMLCKRFLRGRGKRIRLAPCNGNMTPIEVDPKMPFRILGVLHSVVRKV